METTVQPFSDQGQALHPLCQILCPGSCVAATRTDHPPKQTSDATLSQTHPYASNQSTTPPPPANPPASSQSLSTTTPPPVNPLPATAPHHPPPANPPPADRPAHPANHKLTLPNLRPAKSLPKPSSNYVSYISPHSPTKLRFPPSLAFPEWRDRCFRCCRSGHTQAMCRNPMKCGRCWKDGHPGTRCLTRAKVPGEQSKQPQGTTTKPPFEPLFDELLVGSRPLAWPDMPLERPLTTTCFLDRDEDYEAEIRRLRQCVVVQSLEWEGELLADMVAEFAVTTELVKLEEISVASLSCSTCLIHLPPALAPDTFIRAIPARIWDLGLDFQSWSPYSSATTAVSEFKVLLELRDLPIRLWRESFVIRLVSSFGLYLGSLSQPHTADYAAMSVVVATDKLDRIPHQMEVVIGGLRSTIRILPIKWVQAPIYDKGDMPFRPSEFTRPESQPLISYGGSPSSSEEPLEQDEEEMIRVPRKVVLQMCHGRNLESLPPDIRAFVEITQGQSSQSSPHPDNRDVAAPGSQTAGTQTDYQPLGLSLEVLATRDPSSNNPNPHHQSSSDPVEALTPNPPHGSRIRLLRRTNEEIVTETPLLLPAPPASQDPSPPFEDLSGLPTATGARLRPTGATGARLWPSLPHSDLPTIRSADLTPIAQGDNRLVSMCPQVSQANRLETGPSQYGLRSATKRKPTAKNDSGPSKRNSAEGSETLGPNTDIALGLEGFYQIQVSNSYTAKLAQDWGLLPKAVRREIEKDNQERWRAYTLLSDSHQQDSPEGTGPTSPGGEHHPARDL
ncbi:hypothetical protein FCM35_KLT01366 [Carex littledalei]|uniref:CCHC-type domain-containing protein n=1 Tax=Carex littledalei TaxID=544730 RepID=A0A833VN05_9POAL|nr:hypothetical protein FCM35_KLT01366 [Carex littledalei]